MDLVTGGHGFLGTHFCKLLDNPIAPHYREFKSTNILKLLNMVDGRIYHLAADMGGIEYLDKKPFSIFSSNVEFGLNLFNLCRDYSVPEAIIVAGSVCEYPQSSFMREDNINSGDIVKETRGYGHAKRALYNAGKMFEQEFHIRVLHTIFTNIYGPDQNPTHVVAQLVRRFCDAKKNGDTVVDVWGNGEATRDLLYVSDAARLLKEAADKYYGDSINIATGVETTIRELAETIAWACDYTGKIHFDTSKLVGEKRRQISITRMATCGMLPHIEVKEGIKKTVEAYMQKAKD